MANFKIRSKLVSMGGIRLANVIEDGVTGPKLGSANNGEMRLGFSGGSIQLGIVVNGTAYSIQAPGQGGPVVIVRNPS